MTTFFKRLLLAALACIGVQAHAALNVVACEPEWASLAKELGGDKLNVSSATTALQDPHHIEARPSLIARVRGADLLVCTGMELEVGWLPVLIQQSGNARLAVGSPAFGSFGCSSPRNSGVQTSRKSTRTRHDFLIDYSLLYRSGKAARPRSGRWRPAGTRT